MLEREQCRHFPLILSVDSTGEQHSLEICNCSSGIVRRHTGFGTGCRWRWCRRWRFGRGRSWRCRRSVGRLDGRLDGRHDNGGADIPRRAHDQQQQRHFDDDQLCPVWRHRRRCTVGRGDRRQHAAQFIVRRRQRARSRCRTCRQRPARGQSRLRHGLAGAARRFGGTEVVEPSPNIRQKAQGPSPGFCADWVADAGSVGLAAERGPVAFVATRHGDMYLMPLADGH
ncbi:hypothetical protein BH11PSE4_BH11PSE4_24710 [soil metagenome]